MEETKNLPATTIPASPSFMFLDVARFEQMWKIASAISTSTLLPEQFHKNTANCIIALNLADRLHIDFFMMAQCMYIIKGRPGIEGKLAIALIEGTGRYTPLKYKMAGAGTTEKGVPRPESCIAFATEIKTGEIVEGPPVSWKMAEAEGWTKNKGTETSKWQTLPDLMFRYRAAMFFARVNCPGALLGLRTTEEIEDNPIEMTPGTDGTFAAPPDEIIPEGSPAETIEDKIKAFTDSITEGTDPERLQSFLEQTATRNKATIEAVKLEAIKDLPGFWKFYGAWVKQQKAKEAREAKEAKKDMNQAEGEVLANSPCPNNPENTFNHKFCSGCPSRQGCPAWPA